MALQKPGYAFLTVAILLLMIPPVCAASVEQSGLMGNSSSRFMANREQQFGALAVRDAKFSSMSSATSRFSCEASQPPEALATPDPLVGTPAVPARITVSFIVGTDGRVHSPLILDGLGSSGDRIVLDAVRTWRYRPATCNGVPTEVEGKIAFSSR